MTTQYQCKKCKTIFEGIDPFYFGSSKTPHYPLCPKSEFLLPKNFGGAKPGEEHVVGIAVISAWRKTPTITQLTPQEIEQERVAAEKKRTRELEANDLDQAVRSLIVRIESAMDALDFSTSVNFPLDRQYGEKAGKRVEATRQVIAAAAIRWAVKGGSYAYRAPMLKAVWGMEMANFERWIDSTDQSKGKHNFHVVPSN